MEDKIAESFGIVDEKGVDTSFKIDVAEAMPDQVTKPSYTGHLTTVSRETVKVDNRASVLKDFETARDNLLEIIEQGQQAIKDLSGLAFSAQNDKYYMALSSMMKTLGDHNFKLLEIQEKIREIEKLQKNEPKQVEHHVILTTAEMQKLLTGKKDE
jgi:hypothetical protein